MSHTICLSVCWSRDQNIISAFWISGTHLKFCLLHLVIKHGILSYSSPACHRPCSNSQVATDLLTIVCVTPCILQPSEATKLTLLLCTCRLCLRGSEAVRYLIALISIRLRLYH